MKSCITLLLALALTFILALTGCRQAQAIEKSASGTTPVTDNPEYAEITSEDFSEAVGIPSGDYPAAIIVDDIVYLLAYSTPAEIDESAIFGYTSAYTDSFPSRNGETNFNRELNMPYAKCENGIAVLYNKEWHLCLPKES